MRFVILGVFVLVGCTPIGPKLIPMNGSVTTQAGTPVANVTVRFVPDSIKNPKGSAATAITDADGKFQLRDNGALGAVAGWYRVTVTPLPNRTPPPGHVAPSKLVPADYSSETKTPLTFEVKDGASNHYEIILP